LTAQKGGGISALPQAGPDRNQDKKHGFTIDAPLVSEFPYFQHSLPARSYLYLRPATMKVSSTLPAIVATVVVAVNTNSNHGLSGLLSSHHDVAGQSEQLKHISNDYEPYVNRAKVN
jgi:hypothetical protein